jgi:hypothetical protein
MNAFAVLIGTNLAPAGFSPVLIWSTLLVWMAVAAVLAAVVAVVAGQVPEQVRAQRGRLAWIRRAPLHACTLCAR